MAARYFGRQPDLNERQDFGRHLRARDLDVHGLPGGKPRHGGRRLALGHG
jgi:hypothetical protein